MALERILHDISANRASQILQEQLHNYMLVGFVSYEAVSVWREKLLCFVQFTQMVFSSIHSELLNFMLALGVDMLLHVVDIKRHFCFATQRTFNSQ
jgi:hypothetical protein